jgi:hypothetical protein
VLLVVELVSKKFKITNQIDLSKTDAARSLLRDTISVATT